MHATLQESAGFWASVSTLWAAAGAWGTYYWSASRSRDERTIVARTVLSGLKAELNGMRDWVGEGYDVRPLTDGERLQLSNPSRLIFPFNCPSIHGLATSSYITELQPIAENVNRLSCSITRFFSYYEEYRRYANSRPSLYDSVLRKLSGPPPHAFTEEEVVYLGIMLNFNSQIHQTLIGGSNSMDPPSMSLQVISRCRKLD
jgi:hypothetical protein